MFIKINKNKMGIFQFRRNPFYVKKNKKYPPPPQIQVTKAQNQHPIHDVLR